MRRVDIDFCLDATLMSYFEFVKLHIAHCTFVSLHWNGNHLVQIHPLSISAVMCMYICTGSICVCMCESCMQLKLQPPLVKETAVNHRKKSMMGALMAELQGRPMTSHVVECMHSSLHTLSHKHMGDCEPGVQVYYMLGQKSPLKWSLGDS